MGSAYPLIKYLGMKITIKLLKMILTLGNIYKMFLIGIVEVTDPISTEEEYCNLSQSEENSDPIQSIEQHKITCWQPKISSRICLR